MANVEQFQSELRNNGEKKSTGLGFLNRMAGIDLNEIQVPEDIKERADIALEIGLEKQKDKKYIAEIAWIARLHLAETIKELFGDGKEVPKDDSQIALQLIQCDNKLLNVIARYQTLAEYSRDTLVNELKRNIREYREINGSYTEYQEFARQLQAKKYQLTDVLSEKYRQIGKKGAGRHQDSDIGLQLEEAVLLREIAIIEDKILHIKQIKPNVAALIANDENLEYKRQLEESDFMWFNSRNELVKKLLTAAATGTPIQFMGETGTGKTAIVVAAHKILTPGKPIQETQGGIDQRVRDILYTTSTSKTESGKIIKTFNPLLVAMTGYESDEEMLSGKSSRGGSIYLDDEYNTRRADVQMEIKKLIDRAKPGTKITIPNIGEVYIQPGFLYVGTGNPPSEKHSTRQVSQLAAERGIDVFTVDFLEQRELYDAMIATMRDSRSKRMVAFSRQEYEADFIEDETNRKYVLNQANDSGGFVWRFSKAWREFYNAFHVPETGILSILDEKGKIDLDKRLHKFNIDVGVAVKWIGEYKENFHKTGLILSLEDYFKAKILETIEQSTIFSSHGEREHDLKIVAQIAEKFRIKLLPDKGADGKDISVPPIIKGDIENLSDIELGKAIDPSIPRPIPPKDGEALRPPEIPPEIENLDYIDTLIVWEGKRINVKIDKNIKFAGKKQGAIIKYKKDNTKKKYVGTVHSSDQNIDAQGEKMSGRVILLSL